MSDWEQAAQQATADGEPAELDEPAEAAIEDRGILDRLFDGSAEGPAVEELQRDYNIQGWMALILRGVLRAAPGRGMPPIGDISLGGVLGIRHWQLRQQQQQAAESGTEPAESGGEDHSVTVNE